MNGSKSKDRVHSKEYEEFFEKNRIRVNRYLNVALWFFILTGPAIAIGLKTGIFFDIDYMTCISISAVVFIMAVGHLILFRLYPRSVTTCLFSLTALDILIFYITYVKMNIQMTWFLVPLLSLLFCNLYIFFYAVGLNYLTMLLAVHAVSEHYELLRSDFDSPNAYFADAMGAYTIETLVMVAAGLIIYKLISEYFGGLFTQYEVIKGQEKEMKEKMDILSSMAEIYDTVDLIDFNDNTEISLRDVEQGDNGTDTTAKVRPVMKLKRDNHIMPDQAESYASFTDIKTVRERLSHRKAISAEFIDAVNGWFRAQFITVASGEDGIPDRIIYTTRNVDEDKRREEHLIRLSMTDEMTRLYNRRSYDEDLADISKNGMDDELVLFSIDVNGLKKVNDTKGHAAGDELIKGVAECLAMCMMDHGKVYRTGGDEFMAILNVSAPGELREKVYKTVSEWHGTLVDKLTLAVGYASHKEHPDVKIDELEHRADADMYSEKRRYYVENGIDRRK